jgi:HK97 family phage portal protein
MGFLSNFMSGPVHGRGDILERWLFGLGGAKVTSGVRVNNETAMNYSAVWAATRLLTGTMSTLPRELYVQSGRSKNPASGHPTRTMFKRRPNEYQGGVSHLEQQLNFLINWGNAFAEKGRDEFGRVTHLWPIHPERVQWNESEELYYVRNDDGVSVSPFTEDEIFHVPGLFACDGRFGKGVIHHAAESIGIGLATEQFGAAFFGNGAGPAMVMTHPKTLGQEAADNLRRSWAKRYNGPNKANGLLVLEEGTTVSPITIAPEAAQFLQTRQFNVTEIARWYNVPPHLLRELSKSSFNNIESESLHFILISVLPWLVRWEDECNRQLLMEHEQESHFFKFIVHGLLRGDMKTQSQFFKEMWGIGVYDIDEIRELLDMNPVPGGDTRVIPLNMARLKEDEPEPVDGTTEASGASGGTEGGDVQATALNGAQITALLQLGQMLAMGQMPSEGTRAMIQGSFPLMDRDLIDKMVDDIAKFAKENPPPEPVDKQEDELPDDEDEQPADDSASQAALAAVRYSLSCVLTGLIGYESRQAVRMAAKPREFEAKCTAFYDGPFKRTFANQVGPLLAGCGLLGSRVDLSGFVASHIERSKAELLALAESGSGVGLAQFANAVQETVDSWDSRVFEEVDSVFGEPANA